MGSETEIMLKKLTDNQKRCICSVCNKAYIARVRDAGRFCSLVCCSIYRKTNMTGRIKRKFCIICSKEKTGNHLTYCSDCYNQYKRKHYNNNREKEIARSSLWNKKNPHSLSKNMRACRSRRPEFYKNYSKEYRENNKERYRVHDQNKRAKRMSKIKIGIHPSEWLFILELHGNVCYYCRSSNVKLTMDHYIPLSKGGEHIPENIVPACARCNGRKHATMPDVFLERMEKEYA